MTLNNVSFIGVLEERSFRSASLKTLCGLWRAQFIPYSYVSLNRTEQIPPTTSWLLYHSLVHVSCGRLWYVLYMFVALFLPLESSAYVWPGRLGVGDTSLRALQFDIYSGLSKWVWYLFVNVKLAYLIDFNLIVSGYPSEEAQDAQTPQTFV